MSNLLTNATLVSDGKRLPDSEIAFQDGRITHLGKSGTFPGTPARSVDLEGRLLLPGFIDLQINGAGGVLFQSDPTVETLRQMASTLQSFGVTSFLPTLTPTSREVRRQALEAIRVFRQEAPDVVLGINLEGPFINPAKAGMADAACFSAYEPGFLAEFSGMGDAIVYITAAPEVLGAAASELLEKGMVVAVGHTEADYEKAAEFFDAGVSTATHLFNAMTGLSGRGPGVVGAVFDSPSVKASMIADGYHVHPANIRLILATLGPTRVFLISDGMPSLGGAAKRFDYEGNVVTDVDGKCTTEEGVLAGTGIDLVTACRNVMKWAQLPVESAAQMITSTPAAATRAVGVGSLRVGAAANLVVASTTLEVERVIVGGDLAVHSGV